MSSYEDHQNATVVTKKAIEHPLPPTKERCEPKAHKPPPPVETNVVHVDETKSNIVGMWIVIIFLFLCVLFLMWDKFDGSSAEDGGTPQDFAEQIREQASTTAEDFKNAIVQSFSFIHSEIRDIKIRVDRLEAKAHYKKPVHRNTKRSVKRVRISSLQKLKAQAEAHSKELAYRERVWKIFYTAPLKPGESRSHCFGDDCRTITAPKQQRHHVLGIIR